MPTRAPRTGPRPRTGVVRAGEVAAMGAGYFICAALALQLTRFGGGLAIVWLAGALLFAKLCSTPRRRWWPVILACTATGAASSALFGFGRGVALPLAGLGLGEAVVAALLVRRLHPRFGRFETVAETARFLLVAGVIAPGASAVPAAWLVHVAGGVPYGAAWRDWYAGHALGLVAFAPPALLAMRREIGRRARPAGRRGSGETLLLLGGVVLAAAATFGQSAVPLVVLPFVPMIAATVRLGRFGAVASVVLLMVIGLGCSLSGVGPTTLVPGGMALRLQVLQLYFATAVLILLPLAAELKARRRLLDRLRSAEALHRLILDRTGDLILRLGVDGVVRYASPSLARVWGRLPERMVGRSALDVVDPRDAAAVAEARRTAMANPDETVCVEYRVPRDDGALVWVESHMCATVDDAGRVTGTVSIVREVTNRRRLVEDLARQAATDPLTGLANRRTFDDALAARLAAPSALPGCVAAFDLDHFKQVNDQWGHATGDAVLVRFAAVLLGAVRDGDVVARLGGEEFGVLLRGATMAQATAICERVRTRLAEARIDAPTGGTVRVTVSVGIAPLAPGGRADEAMAAADAALYRAKTEGRNRLALVA